mmetsp:Transcript_51766/g.147556  ORF Transcript_51766/g.147556 Transcript_51766/m.147556 type:complete len:225 (-) Transcript_51766:5-679(-)
MSPRPVGMFNGARLGDEGPGLAQARGPLPTGGLSSEPLGSGVRLAEGRPEVPGVYGVNVAGAAGALWALISWLSPASAGAGLSSCPLSLIVTKPSPSIPTTLPRMFLLSTEDGPIMMESPRRNDAASLPIAGSLAGVADGLCAPAPQPRAAGSTSALRPAAAWPRPRPRASSGCSRSSTRVRSRNGAWKRAEFAVPGSSSGSASSQSATLKTGSASPGEKRGPS